jgi:hypothetical protein
MLQWAAPWAWIVVGLDPDGKCQLKGPFWRAGRHVPYTTAGRGSPGGFAGPFEVDHATSSVLAVSDRKT